MLRVEEDVDGVNIRSNGHLEFVPQNGAKKIFIMKPRRKGMAQSLLGCEIIADVENVSVVYTVVINFFEWYFLKDCDGHIFRNVTTHSVVIDPPTKESITRITGMLHAL